MQSKTSAYIGHPILHRSAEKHRLKSAVFQCGRRAMYIKRKNSFLVFDVNLQFIR